MANNGLDIAPPPARKVPEPSTPTDAAKPAQVSKPAVASAKGSVPVKFKKQAEKEMIQFNKRIPRGTADGYEMLAIKTRRKVPELLQEALQLLEAKYGKV